MLSFIGWIASTAITLPLASAISPAAPVRVDLAAWIVLTMALSLGIVLSAARLVFGAWPRVRLVAVLVAVSGAALAVVEELLLHAWAEARFGVYHAQLVWWTASLSGLVIATTIASFGVLVAPAGARLAPMLCQALGVAAVALVVGSNAAGLTDGIRAESIPLATAVGLSLVYVVVLVGIGWDDRRA